MEKLGAGVYKNNGKFDIRPKEICEHFGRSLTLENIETAQKIGLLFASNPDSLWYRFFLNYNKVKKVISNG